MEFMLAMFIMLEFCIILLCLPTLGKIERECVNNVKVHSVVIRIALGFQILGDIAAYHLIDAKYLFDYRLSFMFGMFLVLHVCVIALSYITRGKAREWDYADMRLFTYIVRAAFVFQVLGDIAVLFTPGVIGHVPNHKPVHCKCN